MQEFKDSAILFMDLDGMRFSIGVIGLASVEILDIMLPCKSLKTLPSCLWI